MDVTHFELVVTLVAPGRHFAETWLTSCTLDDVSGVAHTAIIETIQHAQELHPDCFLTGEVTSSVLVVNPATGEFI